MRPAICFEMLYPGLPPEEKVRRIAAHGFTAVEFWGWRDKNLNALGEVCATLGVRVVNFSGHRRGSPIARETHREFLEDLRDAVRTARTLNCPTLMVLSNELGEGGVVLNSWERIPGKEKFAAFVEVLKRALEEIVPENITLVIEPLNTKKDHQGNYLADMKTAHSILDALGHPRLKILADFYHLAWMGQDPVRIAQEYAPLIGHVHVAGVPDRDEPRPGEEPVPWTRVFDALSAGGYEGYVGFEYEPSTDSDDSLEIIKGLIESHTS
mgnify:CR=1 FL=1